MVFTCGDTRRDITMCSAVSFRIRDHGSTRSPGHASTAGAAAGTDVEGAAAAGRGALAGATAGAAEGAVPGPPSM